MSNFKHVIIVYNPNSTGDSKKNADAFKKALVTRQNKLDISIVPTKYAGHALEIARDKGGDKSTVIVSSSGDGGYNEVINGVLLAGGHAAAAVLPAGNANDHHASVGTGDVAKNIIDGNDRFIETIELKSMVKGKQWIRHAHSYIGFGLTPKLGRVMTDQRPNVVTEKWYVLWHSLQFRHVALIVENERRRYSNLLFSTITRMSKVLKLDQDATLHDGKMEVYATRYLSPLGILRMIVTASVLGITSETKVKEFHFKTVRPTLVQLDGEVFTLDGSSDVSVVCRKDNLRTVV